MLSVLPYLLFAVVALVGLSFLYEFFRERGIVRNGKTHCGGNWVRSRPSHSCNRYHWTCEHIRSGENDCLVTIFPHRGIVEDHLWA